MQKIRDTTSDVASDVTRFTTRDVTRDTRNKFEFIKGSDVQPKDINWFWRPYIAFGKIALLAGEPGAGKSTLGIAIAAQATVGNPPPDLIDGQLQMVRTVKPMTVAYLTTENTLSDMTHKDFLDNGGDSERIFYLAEYASTISRDSYGDSYVEHLDDNYGDNAGGHFDDNYSDNAGAHFGENLIRTHEKTGAQLIIIDPFQQFLPPNISITNRDQIWPVIAEIDRAASETGCAILLIHNLNMAAATNEVSCPSYPSSPSSPSNPSAELTCVQRSVSDESAVFSILYATRNKNTNERFVQAVKSNSKEADYTKLKVIRDKHYKLHYEVCSEETGFTQRDWQSQRS